MDALIESARRLACKTGQNHAFECAIINIELLEEAIKAKPRLKKSLQPKLKEARNRLLSLCEKVSQELLKTQV